MLNTKKNYQCRPFNTIPSCHNCKYVGSATSSAFSDTVIYYDDWYVCKNHEDAQYLIIVNVWSCKNFYTEYTTRSISTFTPDKLDRSSGEEAFSSLIKTDLLKKIKSCIYGNRCPCKC